jgi:divalent metal cation (Fe/Co/Zn/Cd) transporter
VKYRLKKLALYAFSNEHMATRTVNFAKMSMLINAIIALGKIGIGVYSLSLFICVNGFYNVGIMLAKYIAVKGSNEQEQRKYYKYVGLIIFVASALYMVYCANMAINGKANVNFDLITALIIATFTFVEIGIAFYGIFKARKINNLSLEAIKRTTFVTARISLVLTQAALLGISEIENAARYCGWTGLFFGGMAVISGLHMIAYSKREVLIEKENTC